MMRRSLLLLAAGAALPARARAQSGPQPELSKERLVIVGHDGRRHEFDVEMALTPEQQSVGLMFRETIPPAGGMLFDWGQPQQSNMWMRNTVSSLDMVFINADGTIRTIVERTTKLSLAIIDSRGPVRATLELAAGTTERLGVRVGDRVLQRIFGNAG